MSGHPPSPSSSAAHRRLVVMMVGGSRFLCQLNRLAWGPLLVYMSRDLSLTLAEKGSITGAFSAGYLWLQIVGGKMGDVYGGKVFQVVAMSSTAIGLTAAPLLVGWAGGGAQSVAALSGTYFAMGLACGPQHPTAGKLSKSWITPRERSWASAISTLSSTLGSMTSSLAVPQLGALLGWKGTFYVLAALTWVFVAVFSAVVTDDPLDHPAVSEEDKLLLGGGGVKKKKKTKKKDDSKSDEDNATSKAAAVVASSSSSSSSSSLTGLLLSGPAFAVFLAHSAYNNFRYTLTAWMPTYYDEVLGVAPQTTGMHLASLDFVGVAVGMFLKGRVDRLTASGTMTIKGVRRLASATGFGLMILAAALAALASQLGLPALATTACLWLGWIGIAVHTFGYNASYLEISTKNTGLLMGVGNTFATMPTFLSPIAVVAILDHTGSWVNIFLFLAACNAVALAVYHLFIDTKSLDDDDNDDDDDTTTIKKKRD